MLGFFFVCICCHSKYHLLSLSVTSITFHVLTVKQRCTLVFLGAYLKSMICSKLCVSIWIFTVLPCRPLKDLTWWFLVLVFPQKLNKYPKSTLCHLGCWEMKQPSHCCPDAAAPKHLLMQQIIVRCVCVCVPSEWQRERQSRATGLFRTYN